MLQSNLISPTPKCTHADQDVPSPTMKERLSSLKDALENQQDNKIQQLLHAIRRDPSTAMAGIVGEVYFEANEYQRLTVDLWSEHLSIDQRFMFNSKKEDARSMAFSRLLTVALKEPHDRLLEVLLEGARELDHPRLLWLVGLHHSDASEEQKATIDAWRTTLTQEQAQEALPRRPMEHHLKETLTFLKGDDLLKMKVVNKSLKQTIDQDSEYRRRTLHNRITGFSKEPRDSNGWTPFSWKSARWTNPVNWRRCKR